MEMKNVLMRIACFLTLLLSHSSLAHAQLNENCTGSILNRTVVPKPDGIWIQA